MSLYLSNIIVIHISYYITQITFIIIIKVIPFNRINRINKNTIDIYEYNIYIYISV